MRGKRTVIKVRLQLGSTSGPLGTAAAIVRNEGFGALYTGLSAGLLRQATYTTARLGLHSQFVQALKERNEGANLSLAQKAGAGLAAGGLGALVGSPADLSLIRMQADGTLPPDQRRNYRGVGHALVDIVKKDGVGGLFTGAGTTSVRAMALNMGMLASNDQAKEMMAANNVTGFRRRSAPPPSPVSSPPSSRFRSITSRRSCKSKSPVRTASFRSTALWIAAENHGERRPLKFYTGFPTYYVRIAPHAMITLMVLDAIQSFQKSNGF